MASREMQRIRQSQREILKKHLSAYPVRLGRLAEELGVSIKVSSLRTGISGQIRREGNQYVIRVNRYEARERQRFTIAHELSHFLLHHHIIDSTPDGITDNVLYRSGASERIEYEANRLAAEIVMPKDVVLEVLQGRFSGIVTEKTIEVMAAIFQVSKAAMEIRLSNINV